MQELIKKIVSAAGINEDQAAKALSTVVSHVKSLVPAPLADNIDKILAGGDAGISAAASNLGAAKEQSIMDKASDIADKAKDKLEDLADSAKEKLGNIVDTEKLEALKDKAEDKLEELGDKAEDMAKDAINKIKGIFGK